MLVLLLKLVFFVTPLHFYQYSSNDLTLLSGAEVIPCVTDFHKSRMGMLTPSGQTSKTAFSLFLYMEFYL